MSATGTARKIGKRTDHRLRYSAFSAKAETVVHFESRIECMLAFIAEHDPRCISYQSQPFSIELHSGRIFPSAQQGKQELERLGLVSKTAFYTPDLCCVMQSGALYVYECKHSDYRQSMPADIDVLEQIFERSGYRFGLVDETFFDAPHSCLATNISALRAVASPAVLMTRREELRRLRDAADRQESWRLSELAEVAEVTPAIVPSLLVSGEISFDVIADVLGPDSQLSTRPTTHPFELLP